MVRRSIALAVVVLVVGAATVLVVRSRAGDRSETASSVDGPVVTDAEGAGDVATPTVASLSPTVSPDSPAAVGVRTLVLTDASRGTSARGDRPELADRPLLVTVRYPTSGMAGDDEIVDAPGLGAAPLVLFAHGFDVSSDRYSTLLHDLASYGFVVAAPDFPMSSTVFDGAPDEYDLPEQSRDLSFLITALTGPDAPVDVAGLILDGPVGLIGHSDGAVTVLLTGYAPRFADPRVAAVIAISGDYDTYGGAWFTTNDPPLIAVHGEWDEINPFASSRELVDNDPGAAMLVAVASSTHLAAAAEPGNAAAVARLAAFDFEWRLKGRSGARESTYIAASTAPLELVDAHE